MGAAWVFTRKVPHNFDGDGKSDIVWRNTSGEAGVWFMNGAMVSSTPSFGVVPNSWSIVGQRDFDGDGKADLLWRNANGDIGIWFMIGASVTSAPILAMSRRAGPWSAQETSTGMAKATSCGAMRMAI